MSVIVNKNTQQTPLSGVGRLANQSIVHIESPRVYILANAGVPVAESLTAFPIQEYAVKSNGVTPTTGTTFTWLDLGIIDGALKITYQKKVKEIRTGLDQILRTEYTQMRTGKLEANLTQYSDYVFEKISGLTASVLQSGSIISYGMGQEDLLVAGLLFVSQNKVDGLEWQWAHPAAYINFEIANKNDEVQLKMTADLPYFTCAGQTVQEMVRTTVFE